MSDPNFHRFPEPKESVAGRWNVFPANHSLRRIAAMWRPAGSNLEPVVATLCRFAHRIVSATGDAYTSEELEAKILSATATPPTVAASAPVDGEAAATLANNTITLSNSSTISIPGGSITTFNVAYLYRGGGLWSTAVGSPRTIRHDGTRWVAKYVNPLAGNYPAVWATGAADADPSTLTWAHASSPDNLSNFGGTFTTTATSGAFAGSTGTAATHLGQTVIVAETDVYTCVRVSPVKWAKLTP